MDNRRKPKDRRDGDQAKFPKDERKNDRRNEERRTKERIPVKMWIRNIDGNANYFQQTGNLSMNGMYILSPNPYPVNTTISVEFQIPGTEKSVKCGAVVLNSREDGQFAGLSVKFTDISNKDKKEIESAIENLISEYWYLMDQ